jgi:hypothetical protein
MFVFYNQQGGLSTKSLACRRSLQRMFCFSQANLARRFLTLHLPYATIVTSIRFGNGVLRA